MIVSRICIGAAVTLLIISLQSAAPGRAAQTGNQQYNTTTIQSGYRLYTANCAVCHGGNGDAIAGVNLARQQFRRAVTDTDIRNTITTGVPAAGMPPFGLQPGELNGVVAYIRSGFDLTGAGFALGDPVRGKAIYDGKGACAGCHRLHGNGSLAGPDLSDIGALRKPSAIQRSILRPSDGMQAINRPVHIVMRDGRVLDGRRLNEDTATVQLMDRQERLVSIEKAGIRQYEIAKASEMPAYAGKLFDGEVADLLAYLLSLRG